MQQLTNFLYAVIFVSTVLLVKKILQSRRGVFPAGPRGWPLLGHVASFGLDTIAQLNKYHVEYGKTFYLKMASHDVIVCADFDLIKNYFTRKVFHARPAKCILNRFTDAGITMSSGHEWKMAKRFALKALKSIGFGRAGSETSIHQEIDHFIGAIKRESKADAIKIAKFTGPAASNVVSTVFIGQRFDYESETRKALDKAFLRPLDGPDMRGIYLGWLNFINIDMIVKYLDVLPIVADIKYQQEKPKELMKKRVKEITLGYDLVDEPSNYIEMYLTERHDNRDNSDFDKDFFNETRLVNTCYSFFVAGSATTQEYLEWWFLLVANYPHVQEKMRQEIDSVLGGERATLSHRTLMPYTEAVIHEVHRFSSLLSLNLPHIASEDADFGPYFLPKGTQIILNIYAIHHDPEYFEDPDEFKPERFLSEDGRKFTRSEKVIPFGIGKRSCPGESLAQAEIFLFTVTTLQKFTLKAPVKFNGKTYTSLFANIPNEPASIIFEPR